MHCTILKLAALLLILYDKMMLCDLLQMLFIKALHLVQNKKGNKIYEAHY